MRVKVDWSDDQKTFIIKECTKSFYNLIAVCLPEHLSQLLILLISKTLKDNFLVFFLALPGLSLIKICTRDEFYELVIQSSTCFNYNLIHIYWHSRFMFGPDHIRYYSMKRMDIHDGNNVSMP